ncbi:response regulator [Spirosoma flavum]|uniref:Response regulator n=1 Tax=Spirosoma flavum TaxID=2048557 RepID=A0ABW6AI87_9BACT
MLTKLLLIEDQASLRENIAEILTLNGYQVVTAEDGRQGISQAVLDPPDLIICDVMMPKLDGYQVLEIVRSTPALVRTPFIFLTAKTDRTDLRHGMDSGADDYLTKPVASRDLIMAIESRLRHKQQWMTVEKLPILYRTNIRGYNDKGSMTLLTEDCLYFFTQKRRYYVLHPLGTFQLSGTIEDLATQLDPVQFFRVNRKEIIHRNTIQRYTYWQEGKYCLFLLIGERTSEVILPRARYRLFLDWLQSSSKKQ